MAAALGLALLVSGLAGVIGYVTQCDVLDYLDRAAAWPANPREQYLFACGHVWRSLDGGRVWTRLASRGLPFGTRDGYIAADRRAGYLYLGLVITSRSSIYCLQCAWTNLRPAIYLSRDGGRHWTFSYKFKRGPAGNSGFLALFADPDREGAAYAVIKNGDEITYYGSGTAGQFWKHLCIEYYFPSSGGCELPDNIVQFQINRPAGQGAIGQ